MSTNPVSNYERLRHDLQNLRPGDHLCCIYETDEEYRALLLAFVQQGFERGEKVVYIVDARTAEEVLTYLRRDGVAVDHYVQTGQLQVLSASDAYTRRGVFDPDAMIGLLEAETERARAEGYSALRVTGEMSWALRGFPGSDRLIEYETKLNEFFTGHDCSAMCQYDRRRFEPAALLGVLSAHPRAIVGTNLYENFYYISPKDLLGSEPERAKLSNWLANLEMRQRTLDDLAHAQSTLRKAYDELEHKITERTSELAASKERLEREIEERRRVEAAHVENLRFQQLISDLSARFVSLPTDTCSGFTREPLSEVIAEVERALRAILAFFRMNRCFLMSSGPAISPLTHPGLVAAIEGGASDPPDIDRRALYPWIFEKILEGRSLFMSRDDLPPEAAEDIATLKRHGSESVLVLPIQAPGAAQYVLGAEFAHSTREYRGDLTDRLLLLGEVFVNAISRSVAEQDLARAEEEYRTIADFTSDWVYWENPDGSLRYVSPSCERITGYAVRELLTTPSLMRDIVLSEDREEWERRWTRTDHDTRGERSIRFRIRHRDGRIVWIECIGRPVIDEDGAFLGFRASNRDITDRKLAEEELHQREQRLAESQRIAHLGSWDWDIVGNRLYWSDEVYRIFGVPNQQFGATYDAFLSAVHPDDRKAVDDAVEQVLAAPGREYSIQHRIVRPDGSERIVHERGEVTFSDGGRPVRMLGTVHDVTELKAMEAESRRLRAELAHLDRVGAMGALTAAIAHETNQPLAAILSNAQAAIRFLDADEPDLREVREALEDIVSDDRRAGKVIQGIRTLARKGPVQPGPYDLNDVIRGVLGLIRSEIILRSAQVTSVLDPGIPSLVGDSIQMQQVVLNLLMNALEAVHDQPEGMRQILVATRREDEDGVLVEITDSGAGVPEEELEAVFRPFYTTKSHGMGMGLAVCRSIIESHGGRMWAKNRPQRGITFSFRLPLGRGCDRP